MSSLSNGEIIAIVTLVAAFPPSVAALCHMVKHLRPKKQPDQTGVYCWPQSYIMVLTKQL